LPSVSDPFIRTLAAAFAAAWVLRRIDDADSPAMLLAGVDDGADDGAGAGVGAEAGGGDADVVTGVDTGFGVGVAPDALLVAGSEPWQPATRTASTPTSAPAVRRRVRMLLPLPHSPMQLLREMPPAREKLLRVHDLIADQCQRLDG
jgi:hypothetical protein